MLLLLQTAMAMDVTITLAPGDSGVLAQTLQCSAADVRKGELLALPAQSLGESTVVPLVEIGSEGAYGVVWLSALKVTTGGDAEYPPLISIARPVDASASVPCAPGQTCTHSFDRAEQSLLLSIVASGAAPGTALPEELIWRTTSWYRAVREVDCEAR